MTPREPDRFYKQAGELARYVKAEQAADFMREVAAALRAEHEATKEWIAVNLYGGHHAAAIRALIPPAAAPAAEDAGRWVLPGGGTGFVEPPAICNACGEPLLTRNLFVDDGCPCNSPRGVNLKPAPCSLCRTDNCVKPAHRIWNSRDSVLPSEPAAPAAGTGKAQAPCWSRKCQLPDGHPGLHDPNPQPAPAQGAEWWPFDKRAADALADEVAVLVQRKVIDSRSPAADALLDYREPPRTPRSDRIAELESKAQAWAAAIEYCEEGFSPEWLTDRRNRSVFAGHIYRLLIAARGAPPEREGKSTKENTHGSKDET